MTSPHQPPTSVSSRDLVAKRYSLIRHVGDGELSSVYEARDTRQADQKVAVKLLNTPQPDALRQEIFRRETRALKRLEHPNVVRILDYGVDETLACPFIVLEYLPRTLLDVLALHARQRAAGLWDWCWPLFRALSDALVAAHSEGIIHRDLKPTNILVDEAGTPKLTDFGVSYLRYELTTGLTVSSFWSPGYAAPEQRQGHPADERSDIYALGSVFYHVLAGQAPPPEGLAPEVIDARLPRVPTSMRRVLQQMVALDPTTRYETAVQLRRALEFTRQFEPLEEVYLVVTERARTALFDQGLIRHPSTQEACTFLLDQLGSDDPRELPLYLDRGRPGEIRLLTDNLRLVCTRDREVPALVIKTVELPYQPFMERDRQRHSHQMYRYLWQIIGRIERDEPPAENRRVLAVTLENIERQLLVAEQSNKNTRDVATARSDFARDWQKVLTLQRQLMEDAPTLPYSEMRQEGGVVTFLLRDIAPDVLAWPDGGLIGLADNSDSGTPVIGRLVGVFGHEVHVTWEPDDRGTHGRWSGEVPASGRLLLVQHEARSALDRQEDAVQSLIEGGTLNPRLPEVLRDLNLARFESGETEIRWVQPHLGDDQRRAVQQALAAQDLFLLLGPPGTGKTITLAEFLLQVLQRQPDARILISSQSNVAVNHAIARVAELHGDGPLEIVRIGRAEKIGQGAEVWTLGQRVARWREDVLQRTAPQLERLRSRIRHMQRWKQAPEFGEPAVTAELEQCAAWLEEITSAVEQVRSWRSHLYERRILAEAAAARRAVVPSITSASTLKVKASNHAASHATPMGPDNGGADGGPSQDASDLSLEQSLTVQTMALKEKHALLRAVLHDLPASARVVAEDVLGGGLNSDGSLEIPAVSATVNVELAPEVPQVSLTRGLTLGRPGVDADMVEVIEEQHSRLVEAVNRLRDPEHALHVARQQLTLVDDWCKVFGRQHDFAKPIFERASIVAATCLIAGGSMLRDKEFDWAVIDEAGRATPPELLVPLVRARRAIIVGDERQLPPMVDDELTPAVLERQGLSRDALGESLFATLVAQAREARLPALQMLTTQYRMHPSIGDLISTVFYDQQLTNGVTADIRRHGLDWLPQAVVWRSTSGDPARFEARRGTGFDNLCEVRECARLVMRMEYEYRALGEQRSVAIITPYQAQLGLLQQHVLPTSLQWQALELEVATVDAVQGRDYDIVLYSPVRSNANGTLGFLRDRRRLNVALSRGRQLLIIVGDIEMLEHGRSGVEGNPYHEVIRYIRSHPYDCVVQETAPAP